MPLSIATSVPFLNCSMWVAWRLSAWPRGSTTISVGAALLRLLEEGRGDRMVFGRIGADDEDHFGVLALVEGRRHRAGADAFHQRGDRGSMAEPRAVIDIVGAEAGAHQLLEQISLFVRAFGRAEAGQPLRAVAVADLLQARGGAVERLVPGRFAEMRPRIRRIDEFVRNLSARRPCGSSASAAAADCARSRSRSGP